MDILSTKIDNLYHSTIEREIANFYDMGTPDNSSFPLKCLEDTYDNYILVCSRKLGEFNVKIKKQPDGKYWLFVAPIGKIEKF